jgi:pimeloyl-ACP methyl ester carboxylesterase
LVDVVALAPWGSDFFRLVHEHADVFGALPATVHEGAVRAYVASASHTGLTPAQADMLVAPWLGPDGQQAFYRQIAQADQAYTDEIESRYPELDLPVLIVWGQDDAWIPVDRARRLADLIPDSRLELIGGAGHLVQIDQPVSLATTLDNWLTTQ